MIFTTRLFIVLAVVTTAAIVGNAIVGGALAYFEGVEREYILEPEPMPPELLPPPKPEAVEPSPWIDIRPKLTICIEPGCRPCVQLQKEIAAGKLDAFQITILRKEANEWPEWVEYPPAAIFTDGRGQRMVMPKQDGGPEINRPAPTAATIIAQWQKLNPGAELPDLCPLMPDDPLFAQLATFVSMFDKFAPFVGNEGTITLQPKTPISASLEDGTTLRYAKVSGRYQIVGGIPSITFEEPFPRADGRVLGLHVGAQILDAKFEPPSTIAIGTSKGRYRFKMEKVE